MDSPSVSRVLSWTIIYLALALPPRSSGCRPAGKRPVMQTSLQLTGFTSTPCHHGMLWALTPLVSPLPTKVGGFVSVALSLELPPVVVNNCHALCCPDFPLAPKRQRSPNELPSFIIHDYCSFWCISRVRFTMPSAS